MENNKITIYQKLLKIQSILNVPKNQFNNYGNYNYRNAEDILNALKPLFLEQNCTGFFESDTIEHVGDRYYLVATFKFVDIETGDHITVQARAREEETKKGMDGAQVTGAASSYARKYTLNGIFLIDDNKDADTNEYHNQQQNGKQKSNKQPQQNQNNVSQMPQQQNQIQYITKDLLDEFYSDLSAVCDQKGQKVDAGLNFILQQLQIQSMEYLPLDKLSVARTLLTRLAQPRQQKQPGFNEL